MKYDKKFYKRNFDLDFSSLNNLISDEIKFIRKIKIPKSNGFRNIYSVQNCEILLTEQRRIKNLLKRNYINPDVVKGFVKKENYLEFLLIHKNSDKFLKIDIKDFFESIKFEAEKSSAKNLLHKYFQNDSDINFYLSNVLFYDNHLAQGFLTSPLISNLYFLECDIRIRRYCQKYSINYSRYADDIIFSVNTQKNIRDYYKPDIHNKKFYNTIRYILDDFNFRINKTKIVKTEKQLVLNGYVIGDNTVNLSRKKLKKLTHLLFILERNSGNNRYNISNNFELLRDECISSEFKGSFDILNYLSGMRAFLIDFIRRVDDENCVYYLKLIRRIECVMKKLYQHPNVVNMKI